MNHRDRILSLVVCISLVFGLIVGCNSRLLPTLLDGSDAPTPAPRPPRKELLKEIDTLKREIARLDVHSLPKISAPLSGKTLIEVPPLEAAKTWDQALAILPKDYAGNPDWVKAQDDKLYRPSVIPGDSHLPVLDLNTEIASVSKGSFSALFAHAPHTKLLTCWNCHPGLFPLEEREGPSMMTMGKMYAGQYCGACHGSVAFGFEDECSRCHLGLPPEATWKSTADQSPIEQAKTWPEAKQFLPSGTDGEVDWVKALEQNAITPKAGPDEGAEDGPVIDHTSRFVTRGKELFNAVFSHKAHTQWLTCTNCHMEIFPMQRGAGAVTMEQIEAGQGCGVCHGTVVFGVSTGCLKCHPALRDDG